jgi:anaerobic ribonucleoside-triphosphate reductase
MNPVRVVPCEIYSRVVGYFRPVSQWNPGKREEFSERRPYRLPEAGEAVRDIHAR